MTVEMLKLTVAIYAAIGFAKCILVLADVGVAGAVAHRVTGRPAWRLTLGFAVGVVLTTLPTWPLALRREGWRFFLAYSRFSVMRQILEVYRDAANLAESKSACPPSRIRHDETPIPDGKESRAKKPAQDVEKPTNIRPS